MTQALAADTIKVGILHSLSGTIAISETSLKDVCAPTANCWCANRQASCRSRNAISFSDKPC
jgi:Periplasmic binding protein domain